MAMPTVVGVGSAASGQAAVTAAYPSGYTPTADDIGIIVQECENSDIPAAPSGWTIITTQPLTTGTTSKLTAMWRRIQAGDTAPSVPDPTNHQTVAMIVVRGCVTAGNPWDVFASTTELVADTSVSVPGVTTTAADCLVLAAAGTGQDVSNSTALTWANASLANVTHRVSTWTQLGLGGGFAFCTGEKAAAGATGNTTTTLAVAANFKTLLTIALKGAAAGTDATVTASTVAASASIPAPTVRIAATIAAATLAATAAFGAPTIQAGATATPATVAATAAVGSPTVSTGGAAPTIREVLHTTSGGGNATVVTGAGTQVGDVLVCIHGSDFYAATGMVSPTGTAGTWTLETTADLGTNNSHIKVWTRPVTSGGAQTVTTSPITDEENFNVTYVLIGADTTDPSDAAANSTGTATTAHLAPSVSPTSSASLLICAVLTQTFALANYTCPVLTKQTEDDNLSTLATGTQALSASGATGTRTFTSDTSTGYASVSIAIRPSGAAGGDATVTATTVAGVGAIPGPSIQAGATATPATLTGTAAVGSPTIRLGVAITATTVAATAALGAPTVSAGATTTPATVSGTATVPSVTIRTGATATPATLAATATVPAPSVSAGGNAAITATTLTGTATIPAATLSTGAKPTPATVAGTVSVPSVTIRAGANVTATTVTAVAAVASPAVQTSTSVTAATLTATASIPTPTVGQSVAPATVAGVAAIATPSPSASVLLAPSTLVAVAAVGLPTVTSLAATIRATSTTAVTAQRTSSTVITATAPNAAVTARRTSASTVG